MKNEFAFLHAVLTSPHLLVFQPVRKLVDRLRFQLTYPPFFSVEVDFWLEVFQTVFWKINIEHVLEMKFIYWVYNHVLVFNFPQCFKVMYYF